MRYFLIVEPDGDCYVAWTGDGMPPVPPGACSPVEVPRLPEAFEWWDGERFVRDDVARIDADHTAVHGAEAIAVAHARKAIEAELLLAGIQIPGGMIASEAARTGQDAAELAQSIADKARPAIEAEAGRIAAKRAARAAIEKSQGEE